MLVTIGRILAMHWPALIAWTMLGGLGRHFALQFAGWVGAYSTLGGVLILPLAALSRLVSIVAMFLIVRDALLSLQTIAPMPKTAAERRTTFINALFVSILPFFAVYAAWGMFSEDRRIFVSRMLDASLREGTLGTGQADDLTLNPLTITVTAVAFAARWALKHWQAKLPKWTSTIAVYFEALWVTLFIAFITFTLTQVIEWMNSRIGLVWLHQLRAWFSEHLAPVSWIWDSIEFIIGQIGGLVFEPLAWLLVAGVIYGQTLKLDPLTPNSRIVSSASKRVSQLPEEVRNRAKELSGGITDKLAKLGAVLVLMLRSGPTLIAGFILLYVTAKAAEPAAEWIGTRILGPHEVSSYWVYADILVTFFALIIVEPIRVAVVAAAYDTTLATTFPKAETITPAVELGGVSAAALRTTTEPVATTTE